MSFQIGREFRFYIQKIHKKIKNKLKRVGAILDDEGISSIIREEGFSDDVLRVLESLQGDVTSCTQVVVEIHSIELYEKILKFDTKSMMVGGNGLVTEAMVNTKYKTIAKKVKPVATQLPPDSEDHIKKAEEKPRLRGRRHILGTNLQKKHWPN